MLRKKLLIIDDDEGIREIFQIIFEKSGYEVEILSDAAPVFENNFANPDLFILDKNINGKDGLEICRILKDQNHTKDIPIIIVSATPRLKELADTAGADAFIEKPFQMKEIVNLVQQYI